jgi:ATP-dependent RNA helicase MSS116
VQQQSIPVALQPSDILAKAKTGTGKTLAFLIPACHKALSFSAQQRRGKVSVLVVSPTRELCQQIFNECQILCSKVDLKIQCVYGGTKIKKDLSKFRQSYPDILIATPGRLNDHLENYDLARATQNGLRVLIFDEADQMLEMGFRPEITKMLKFLPPKETRQNMLFSATMPKDIANMADIAMTHPFNIVDTVGKDKDTHERVPQFSVVHPLGDMFEELVGVLREAMKVKNFKIMAFFVTARLTQVASELFDRMDFPILEIHSRKSQSHRTKTAAKFRDGCDMIMFSSDVSARGMDYPNITTVIQVGLPSDKAQYVHRLGRTARAGKGGKIEF